MSIFPVFMQSDRPGRRNQPSNNRIILGVTPDGALTLLGPANQSYQPSIPHNILSSDSSRQKFEINLDVHHFAPEDITVKTVDGFLIIKAGHEEKQDEYGWVKRQITRRYALPEGCNIDAIESRLSSDGVLTVFVPQEDPVYERMVPIIRTGPVRSQAGVKSEVGDGESPETVVATVQ